MTAGDEVARPAPGLGEPFCPADGAENRQGQPDQQAEQPSRSSPARHRRLVRRQRCPLLRRIPADVDPVRYHRLRHAVPAHLSETMTGQQAKDEQQPGGPGDQLARHRRLHDPHSRQPGCPCADLVHPDVVAMTVAALRVIAQQQVRVLFREQSGELPRRFPHVRPREPRPARRVLVQHRPVPAVRIAEMHDPVRAEDRGARAQLLQPPALIRAGPHVTIAGHDDDHPMTIRRQPGDRPPGQQHLVIWMSVKRHNRRHRRETTSRHTEVRC
jgi:hypothetical protein